LRLLTKKLQSFFCRFEKTILIVILAVIITSLVNLALFSYLSNNPLFPGTQYSSRGNVNVTGIQVPNGELPGNSIDWGTMYVGSSKNVSFHLQSTSNVPIKLDFNTTDWTPWGIDKYLKLSWNYTQQAIDSKQEIFLTFTLNSALSEDFENYLITNNIDSFSFNVNIYPKCP
jgi:hypothetical protein